MALAGSVSACDCCGAPYLKASVFSRFCSAWCRKETALRETKEAQKASRTPEFKAFLAARRGSPDGHCKRCHVPVRRFFCSRGCEVAYKGALLTQYLGMAPKLLTCRSCGHGFEAPRSRGLYCTRCPACALLNREEKRARSREAYRAAKAAKAAKDASGAPPAAP